MISAELAMKPTVIDNGSQLKEVAEQMLEAARKYPCTTVQHYSTNETEVIERSREVNFQDGAWLMSVGLANAILYKGCLISLAITLETVAEKPQYRLSMCCHGRSMLDPPFLSVPNELANLIAKTFCEHAQVVPNPSGIAVAKHYIWK